MRILPGLCMVIAMFWSTSAQAGHIIGGEMFHDDLGGGQYRITLKLYRECSGIGFDDPAPIGVYTGTGTFIQAVYVDFPGGSPVPVDLDDPCLSLPPNLCLETTSYSVVLDLPPTADGYIVSYQRCCRTPIINNLLNPDDLGITVLTQIPGSAVGANSAPRFSELPPVAVCLNEPLVFDHSATDPDGDELVYELCTPFNGGTPDSPSPTPSQLTAPPYDPIPWAAGYSGAYPIDSDPAISIDASTGQLTLTPTLLGFFVVGVCVSEYRGGELLGTTRRDFLFSVVACNASVVSSIAPQAQPCTGLTATFNNNSNGAQTYAWDFGDASTDLDVSTALTPTWTYAAPGEYTVTLIANPGTVCADTSIQRYRMYEAPVPFFSTPDPLCGPSQVDLVARGIFDPLATISWHLGTGAQPATAQGMDVSATFGTGGSQLVTLTVEQNGCTGVFAAPVVVNPEPEAFFLVDPPSPQPPNTVVRLTDASLTNGGSIVSWSWEANGSPTGDATDLVLDTSVPGRYLLTLTVSTAFGCTDTYTTEYIIIPQDVEIPNVFTPNADGQNDAFVIANAQYWRNSLTIFNRWGMPVHEAKDYKSSWRALNVPDGTYYYVFTLEDGREFTGHVTILR